MAIGGRGWSRFDLQQRQLDELLEGPNGPVARRLQADAEKVAQEMKRLAPTDTGRMRSSVEWVIGRDGDGLHADIGPGEAARTPEGYPYPVGVEFGTKPHRIDSKGDYPLRNRRTGQVFGRRVQHPGNRPQPFIRPALDVL